MNYLAHLHIADACQSSLLGNLLGDFIKGNPEGKFPNAVVQGIRLHRFIDAYTDHHPVIHDLKNLFDGPARRFASIALDVFWDHCLSLQWHDFHDLPLSEFCHNARERLESEMTFPVPERFRSVNHKMWQGMWLMSYGDMDNIERALKRIALRSERMHALHLCYPFLKAHYDTLRAGFEQFYPLLLTAAENKLTATGNASSGDVMDEAIQTKNNF
ncbi:Acyl carrier protein phosphodiesterase [Vibrio aerogenes CECT 7868]|uniref:Acyl carrier protein phosphodiesterase n=1 Tax=Vibrio aerogenes CECT 7868 TaxID=1216006 RepID=A0A1M5VUS9_9VIBR|nr:ACP phosphodiesterase [Vibrio aerogenes]SHH78958.1 Acyl carrier protein phosphodiesterase [Vibrio aerogenes CECT 7868]